MGSSALEDLPLASEMASNLHLLWRPRQDSNLGTRFRKPTLYPLSYGGCSREATAKTQVRRHFL